MEISPGETSIADHKHALQAISERLPLLETSTVEYTTDQFCHSSKDVEWLFDLERMFLRVKNVQYASTYLAGGQYQIGRKNRLNYVYQMQEGVDKAYERGPDNAKEGEGWPIEKCDGVRLEHTADKAELRQHGIGLLRHLIEHCKFHEINKDRFHFSEYKQPRTGGLPNVWSGYRAEDSMGERGAFMTEHQRYRKHRRFAKTLWRYVEDNPGFDMLLEAFERAWTRFDEEWRRA